jgi:hypothetical protein
MQGHCVCQMGPRLTTIPTSPTEQRKCLRKEGLCWDVTFVIGEHIACIMLAKWNSDRWGGSSSSSAPSRRVVELRAGIGLCSIMIALMVPNCLVKLTNLPKLQDLMQLNIERNFGTSLLLGDVIVSCPVLQGVSSWTMLACRTMLLSGPMSSHCPTTRWRSPGCSFHHHPQLQKVMQGGGMGGRRRGRKDWFFEGFGCRGGRG